MVTTTTEKASTISVSSTSSSSLHGMSTIENSSKTKTSAYTSVASTTVTMIQTSSKSCSFLHRKRRRYLSELHLMLMMFIVSSSFLILGPVQATAVAAMQDYGSVTAKGENVFMVATSDSNSNDDDLGNALPYEFAADEQEEADDGEGLQGDATNDDNAGDGNMAFVPNVGKEHLATEDIEMMQPPHSMRHRKHYKSRLIQNQHLGLNDLKLTQQPENDGLLSNRHLRYQQIQHALREPVTPLPTQQQKPQHHHHHHRHHHQQHSHQHHRFGLQEEFKWHPHQRSKHRGHQDHLGHYSRFNFSSTPSTKTTTTTKTMMTTTMRPRYFDRDGLYTNPLTWMPSTQGPLPLDEEYGPASKIYQDTNNRLHHDNGDDDADGDMHEDEKTKNANEEENEKEFKRISLSLDANREAAGNGKLFDTSTFDSDDDDDYSYEDDEESNDKIKSTPPLITANKLNVKRYTNPSRTSYKSQTTGLASKRQHFAKYSFDDDNDNYDDNDNNEEDDRRSDAMSDNDDDNFSDEKWNKIEHEHYRKQMQHQQAMQALRSRRPPSAAITSQLDNTPNSITKTSRFTSSAAASSAKSVTSAKRQILNDDDSDNIYSRYYVPGSISRRKEEELGSPTAIMESRRQYAMQQRQNKALASAHHRRIVKDGSCRLPQPRIERIRKDSWKIYTPHCTILHRCADDTGCCPSERQTCAPKRTKNIDLYFFVISLNETQGSIERLTFVNHTECHCVDKSKQKQSEYPTDEFGTGGTDPSSNHIPFLRRATILNCNCPNLYEKILQEDGFCRCDCSSGNMGCDWLKRGMEHFSMNDRKCISEGRCKLPTCEYGAYVKKHGRCPRREERQLSIDTVDW